MTADEKALVSVLLLDYNNGDTIYQTLESILGQTYPRIEIVISDDRSESFDADGIGKWIEENKKENIENVIINMNPENVGTVRNIETAVGLAHGSIITQIAADDAFYSPSVFETFVNELERLGDDALFLVGQAKMMNADMTREMYDFVNDADKKMIIESTPEELFEKSSARCFVPAVNFWRNGLQDRLGTFSDRYRLIEDYTKTLRMSRLGIRIHYLDEYIIKHRDGGISHGNKKGSSRTYLYYVSDFVSLYRNEVIPYMGSFSNESMKAVMRSYTMWLDTYDSLKGNLDEYNKVGGSLITRVTKKVLLSAMNVLQRIYDAVSSKR